MLKKTSLSWDARRDLIIPGDHEATLIFCVEHFIDAAKQAIRDHGFFFVALSGGSTPKAIYEKLSSPPYRSQVDWSKCHLFWSDERSVPPDDPESNYHMAMEAGLKSLSIPLDQIHRMVAEDNIEKNGILYEKTLSAFLGNRPFDLIMLGMGEDGHTASLFPHTQGLKEEDHLVIANFIPQKKTWRMTLTYPCINAASKIAIYVLGSSKKEMLFHVLTSPDRFDALPSQKIGTKDHKALWIADERAAVLLMPGIKERQNYAGS